ncbi:uncharacterized protein T551_00530 [Pneumocystis jirovecii RU7]|uniref:PCI domain-containing protein n=1 Tax=Pneumocystis jirovecii (strain RU7) TaxID=1408657 RepID=A0A0W4ZVP7_PNEJ7|nr:uncharacterized protein T551_00530 [Pneumocystis jirovecii RU7]KTW32440.1 hypothetical protein T551_00530 [Pneumocystis jirovecii RU7]
MNEKKLDVFLPTFDLSSYISNYKGYTRIERLIFISEHCSSLSIEALEFAINLSQSDTLDTVLYEKLAILLQKKCPDKNITLNVDWILETKNKAKSILQKLEFALQSYKNSFIKESIRMGYNSLGDHYYTCRDLDNSLKFYSKASEFCTTPKHVMNTLLNIIKVSLEQKKFLSIQSQLSRMQNTSLKNEINSKIQVISGLVHFNLGNYREAALTFCMIKNEKNIEFNDIISINDVVIYAIICALPSFSRHELKQYIIDNTEFRKLLELEPQILEVALTFYSSNYSKCFDILNRLKNDFILDIYLSKNVDNIFLYIRQKAYILYLKPFSSVDLRKMANVFLFLLENIEKELIQLIMESKICAKIDNVKKFLIIIESDQHDTIYKRIHKISSEYKKCVKLSLVHMNLVKEGLEVKPISNSINI